MAVQRNYVQLIGHLGADPEITRYDNGRAKAVFRLATNEYYRTGDGETVETTQWHRIVAWGPLAEYIAQNYHKGNWVLVQGRIQYRSYQDEDGNTRYITEINARDCLKLTKEPSDQTEEDK